MPPARLLQLVAIATVLVTAYFFLLPEVGPISAPRWHKTASLDGKSEAELENEVFTELKLPSQFEYRRHCINAKPKHGLKRESLIEIPHAILGDSKQVTIKEEAPDDAVPESILPPCESTIRVEVPEFDSDAKVKTSELMLGVATTLKRINDSLPAFSRWLSNTGSPMLVLLVDQPKLNEIREPLAEIYAKALDLGIELIFEPYLGLRQDNEGLKNFALAEVLHKNRKENTKWFGVMDDDTFFLSLPRVFQALEPYDYTKMWYIGALTEGHSRISEEGFKAWGGAGFFISPPLMEILAKNSEDCKHLPKIMFGDLLWRDCIINVTSPTVHLTELRGLNQIDMWGDLSGWYEAGPHPLLTIHHWKSWHLFAAPVSHIVSDVAGPDAFLQRYQLLNNTVLTNGYTIVEYPKGLPNLQLAELTMVENVGVHEKPKLLEFHHSLGNTRPALEYGTEKISWSFRHAVKSKDGVVRQFYIKNANGSEPLSLIELDWRRV